MKNRYSELLKQTFDFPQEEFKVENGELYFHDIHLMDLVKKYGTPLKLTYLPKITEQIKKARILFNVAIAKNNYNGTYNYCYCTKSSHFQFVLEETLKNNVNIETSSAFDIPIVKELFNNGKFNKENYVICNGYKRENYTSGIIDLINDDFNVIPILDNKKELLHYKDVKKSFNIGIRVSAFEQPDKEFYSSRLGIRSSEIIQFYKEQIKDDKRITLKMVHFFISNGIKDNAYYWSELNRCVETYCKLRKECPSLDSLNIGGGFPIKTSLEFNYDYQYMAEEIVKVIKDVCDKYNVDTPNIFSEFGSFTVGESGAVLYSVIDQKIQNDSENWYMIDSSFITTLPDVWGIDQKFILLPLNNWEEEYNRAILGGLTCDSDDYYNTESHTNQVFLPKYSEDNPLLIGFFHTGAYQESLGGYGGIQHCLIPAPKHILIDLDEDGEIITQIFSREQGEKSMLKILGY